MQVQLLVTKLTLVKGLDQFYLLTFNVLEQKLDYRTVLTQHKIHVLTQLMLVLHVLVSFSIILVWCTLSFGYRVAILCASLKYLHQYFYTHLVVCFNGDV